MSDRDNYIKERNSNEINIDRAWEMYSNSDVKHKMGQDTFLQALQIFAGQSNMDKYWNKFDVEYNIMKLTEPDGKIRYL